VTKSSIRILSVLGSLIVVALVLFAAISFILQPSSIAFRERSGLGKSQTITAQAGTNALAIGKGDVFPFLLEVQYDSTQITGIDRSSLDKAVDVKPFEIKSFQEAEFDSESDPRTRIYQREYDLQFITGSITETYQLPTIVVRYQLRNGDAYAEKAVVPDPIRVTGRLPADVSNLELRPLTDKVQDPSKERFVWALWALGVVLVVGSGVDLITRVLPKYRQQTQQLRCREGGDVLVQAYRSLNHRLASKAAPAILLNQIDHMLRLVLVRKAKANWLEEPNLEDIPHEIQPVVAALFENCQLARSQSPVGLLPLDQTLSHLDAVLRFYYGAREVEAWKD
jgi:hypothetical protein